MVAEAAHIFIVQISALIALILSLISSIVIGKALARFTPGEIKTSISLILSTIVILTVALVFMFSYHYWDIQWTEDAWHVGAMVSLLFGTIASVYLASVTKKY
ncbi:hypothetical protein HY492_01695 [Candidatus Woesearchaeota archaeon]|nr:hypothetical protein [Candidatus Woesearchaeota archaeon]